MDHVLQLLNYFQKKIPCTLVCDSMLSSLFAETKIDVIIVGAERIAANGDVISTIGTYQLAILAKFFNIHFIVAAPSAVIDLKSKTGKDIEIEKFSELEVTQMRGEVVEDEGNVKEPMPLFNSPSWEEEYTNDIFENENNEDLELYTESLNSSVSDMDSDTDSNSNIDDNDEIDEDEDDDDVNEEDDGEESSEIKNKSKGKGKSEEISGKEDEKVKPIKRSDEDMEEDDDDVNEEDDGEESSEIKNKSKGKGKSEEISGKEDEKVKPIKRSDEDMEEDDTTYKSIHSHDELMNEPIDTSNNDNTSIGGNDAKSITSFDSYRSGSTNSKNNSNTTSSSKVYPKKAQRKDFSLNTQTLITKLGQNVIDVLEGLEERMRFNVHGSNSLHNNSYQIRHQSSMETPITSMTVKVSTPDVHVYAPAYDITPSNLISAIITDKKVLTRDNENETFDFQELFK